PPAIRARARLAGGVIAGDRAPDAEVVDATTGTTTRLFTVLRSGRHCLLLRRSSQQTADAVQRAYPDLIDVAYSVSSPNAMLIRPDGYIGYIGSAERVLLHLAAYLIPDSGRRAVAAGSGGGGVK